MIIEAVEHDPEIQEGVLEISVCHGYAFETRIDLLEHQVSHFSDRSRRSESEQIMWREVLLRRIELDNPRLEPTPDRRMGSMPSSWKNAGPFSRRDKL